MRVLFPFRCVGLVERLGLMQLAAVLRRAGHEPILLNVLGLRTSEAIHRVLELRPSLIGYTANTGEHVPLLVLAREIRHHWDAHVVFGGPHATFFPEIALDSSVDAACRGEGEGAILEMVTCLEEKRSFTGVSNLWTCSDRELVRNPVRPLIEDLDALPWADRTAYYEAEPEMRDFPTKMFMATRGCPHRCSYCFNHAYHDLYNGCRLVAHRSVESLLEEIKDVRLHWRLEQVWIDDDCFLTKPPAWLDAFAEDYPRRVGLPLQIQVRPDLVTSERARLLAAAGVKLVAFGIETGTEEVRYSLLDRKVSNECIREAAAVLRKVGIKFITLNMLGLPVSDPFKEGISTLRLNREVRPDYACSFVYTPYPRTALAERARKNGFLADIGPDAIPQTDKMMSVLTFPHRGEKALVERLHKLFDFIVQVPIPETVVRALCKLPFDRVYAMVYLIWYGFNWRLRLDWSKKRIGDLALLLRHFAKYVRGVL
jgi:anaerobic magnesium-protoporphyrin IX monomethyl ester cyclase